MVPSLARAVLTVEQDVVTQATGGGRAACASRSPRVYIRLVGESSGGSCLDAVRGLAAGARVVGGLLSSVLSTSGVEESAAPRLREDIEAAVVLVAAALMATKIC